LTACFDLTVDFDLRVGFNLRVRFNLGVGFKPLIGPGLQSHLGRNWALTWKSIETERGLDIKVELGSIDCSLMWKSIWA